MQSLERIGRYRLERRLGSGAFGTVWLAHDDQLEAPVAVKVLAENWSHRLDIRDRFLSEARLLRRADSNRVVQVYDIGELPDGRPYFVMEYGDAGTLADLLESGPGPLPVPEALRLAALTARAAAALHDAGIVHRDIKPSNVLLRTAPDGSRRLLLGDLGLAKSLAHASGLTLAAGSAGYQPPEQAEPGTGIDARADVYSLGAVGYKLVTGTVPGAPGRVVPPDQLRPGLGEDVVRALLRALEPDRERRWPDARGFAEELERLAGQGQAQGQEQEQGQAQAQAQAQGQGQAQRRRPEAQAQAQATVAGPGAVPSGSEAAVSAASAPNGREAAGLRRRRRLLVLTTVAVLAAGAAAAVIVPRLDRDSPAEIRVADSTGRVSADVPGSWGRQLRDSGWNPSALGLPGGQEPGLAVADDLAAWPDLSSPVNGVFIGLSERGDVAEKVNSLTHRGCRYAGSHAFADAGWTGRTRVWTGCPDGGSVTETALAPAGGGTTRPQVYVQLREHADGAKGDAGDGATADTDRVLRSLRVT